MGVGWRLEAPAWVEGLRAGEDDGSKGDVGVGNGWLPWGCRRSRRQRLEDVNCYVGRSGRGYCRCHGCWEGSRQQAGDLESGGAASGVTERTMHPAETRRAAEKRERTEMGKEKNEVLAEREMEDQIQGGDAEAEEVGCERDDGG